MNALNSFFMGKFSRLLLCFLSLLLACDSATATKTTEDAPAGEIAAVDGVRVELAQIQTSNAMLQLLLPGEVEGSSDAILASALGGYVERVSVAPGDTIKSGASIAKIDAEIHAAAFKQAEAQYEFLTSQLKRLQAIGEHSSKAELQKASTDVKVAKARLRQSKANYRRAKMKAPFAGTIAQINVSEGEVVPPGGPVARLVSIDKVKVTLSVSDRDVIQLKKGMSAMVETNAHVTRHAGKISHISPAGNIKTRTFEIEVTVDNPEHLLLPGMIARVHLNKELKQNSLLIPQDVLVTTLKEQGVFVSVGGKAQWRKLSLGEVVGDQVVVKDGLAVGEKIVVVGQRKLVDGDPLIVAREGVCCTNGRVLYGVKQ